MEIRTYQDSDHAGVVELWREVFPDAPPWNAPEEMIRRKATVQPELFLVALADETVIGTVLAGFDGHRGWVHYVAVKPQHRRQGVGAALMDRAEKALAALGCPKLNLQVRASNEQLVQFYQRVGYQVEERISMAKHLE